MPSSPRAPKAYPIATAPLDGRLVWLCDATGEDVYWGPGYYMNGIWYAGFPHNMEHHDSVIDDDWTDDPDKIWTTPTHWTPYARLPKRMGRGIN